jgi:hypothetical protein
VTSIEGINHLHVILRSNHDGFFNLKWGNDLSSLVDNFLRATVDEKIPIPTSAHILKRASKNSPIRIHITHITRIKPAFAGECRRVQRDAHIRRNFVSLESGKPTNRDSARLTTRKLAFQIAGITNGQVRSTSYA